ncbi:leucine-rich repeat-containing protein kinase family protein [Variovorax ginsengisoli]|uniref:Protein kinase domain-containing protein n=1 Tax=Variovorax ginsengisoli TaxID=363844 RepID=A0ABT9S1K6_9BURK|nr:leucine-rich repeat-containing protein kinase family protein [Variovorax ginsengisoli]MDP9898226.1 hypothetical protein [Variovorax ginsengisoli]
MHTPSSSSPASPLSQLRSGALAGTRRLDLSCGLTEFPPEIFSLADSLEILNLSGNALRSLPDDLHRLHRLRVIFCSDNPFTELPVALGACERLEMIGFKANRIRHVAAQALPPALRWLILTDNDIAELPDALGARPRLQKLMLAGNRLTALPGTLAACTSLELLRIAANGFEVLPSWLPAMPRLSWLACSGNPFNAAAEAQALAVHPIPAVDWSQIELDALLGEGASGRIYRAHHSAPGVAPATVAVKLFKGAITSDGRPDSEMAACIAAGTHPNLIGVRGRITGHPEGTQGLVMRLIDPSFRVLAGPPSFASCTRDVYAGTTRFTPGVALRLATGIAAAAAHLHARGILHGDLYAHNILWNDTGDALLGDFGAASFFDVRQPADATRTEVRAFGCLLEELLERCDAGNDAAADAARSTMTRLQAHCLADDPAARPSMAQVHAQLLQAA